MLDLVLTIIVGLISLNEFYALLLLMIAIYALKRCIYMLIKM